MNDDSDYYGTEKRKQTKWLALDYSLRRNAYRDPAAFAVVCSVTIGRIGLGLILDGHPECHGR